MGPYINALLSLKLTSIVYLFMSVPVKINMRTSNITANRTSWETHNICISCSHSAAQNHGSTDIK